MICPLSILLKYWKRHILSFASFSYTRLPVSLPSCSPSHPLSLSVVLNSSMATLEDIGVSAFINILTAFTFLLAFAILKIQPINDRVYFPKWYINGERTSPRRSRNFVGKFVNLNVMTYFTFLNWMPQAMRRSEAEIISHAGVDSAVFLRIYTLGYSLVSILLFFLLSKEFLDVGVICFSRKSS